MATQHYLLLHIFTTNQNTEKEQVKQREVRQKYAYTQNTQSLIKPNKI